MPSLLQTQGKVDSGHGLERGHHVNEVLSATLPSSAFLPGEAGILKQNTESLLQGFAPLTFNLRCHFAVQDQALVVGVSEMSWYTASTS